MEEFTEKILDISFDKDKIIRILNKKEIEEIRKKWTISFIFKLRRKFKIFLLNLLNFFSFDKDIVYVNDRSLEKVKNKYDNPIWSLNCVYDQANPKVAQASKDKTNKSAVIILYQGCASADTSTLKKNQTQYPPKHVIIAPTCQTIGM